MAKKRQERARVLVFIWVLTAALVLVGVYRFALVRPAAARHPEPRPDITARGLAASEGYASAADVARVYTLARVIPNVLDGLYCARHAGHRSLLTCFESDHGAGCDVCLGEAALAHAMTQDGASLQQIRDAIDARFGS